MPELRYSISYKPSAAKALRKLERQYQQTIISAIEALAFQQVKPPTTIAQQIEILRKRGMDVDEDLATQW